MMCSVAECDRPRKYRELCGTHYERLRVGGSLSLAPRTVRICEAPGCEERVFSSGYCQLHYQRVRRLGTTVLPVLTARERFDSSYVIDASGCWIWTGRPGVNGYGVITIDGHAMYAHRLAYELHVGPIPDGLTIDHLCMVRICVNPAHLEAVTRAENTRRELAARYSAKEA